MTDLNRDKNKLRASRKPRRCPNCKHYPLASILYGLYGYDEKLEKDIDEGRVVLGGCEICVDDPAWMCSKCGLKVHKELSDWQF